MPIALKVSSVLKQIARLVFFLSFMGGAGYASAAEPIKTNVASNSSPAAGKLEEGVKAMADGNADNATKLFEEAAKLDPKSATPLLRLAELAARQRKMEAVEGYLQRAQQADPRSVDVGLAWARFYLIKRDANKAEEAFKNSVSWNPKSLRAHAEYGAFLLHVKGDPVGAEQSFRNAIEVDIRNAASHYGLGTALAAQQKFDPAIAEFEQAAKLDVSTPLPVYAIGRIHVAQSKWDLALAAFDRALAIQPKMVSALLDKGNILEAKGDGKAALALFEQAVNIAPNMIDAQLRLGSAYQNARRLEEAQKAYEAAVKIQPNNLFALNNLAWLAAERKTDLDRALELAKKAVSLSPQTPYLNDTLGYVYLARQEPKNAIEPLKIAAQPATGKQIIPSYVYRLGLAYAQTGQSAQAIEQFKKAIDVGVEFPEKPDAEKWLAKLQPKK